MGEIKYYILIQDTKEFHLHTFYGGRPFDVFEIQTQLKNAIKIHGAEKITVVKNVDFDFDVTVGGI
jgi:hypothetical protein